MQLWRMALGMVLAVLVQPVWAVPASLAICVDENPWPPYTYWKDDGGDRRFIGYTVAVATTLLARLNINYTITALPWTEVHRRAQLPEANAGCDMILDVSFTPERERYLRFTQPLYQLHYSLVYSSRRYPKGLPVKTFKEVGGFRVCGVEGYNYAAFAALNIQRLPSIQAVLDQLEKGSCEVYPVEATVLRHGEKAGLYRLPPYGCVNLAGVTKAYRLALSRRVVGGEELLDLMGQELGLLWRNGTIARLADVHGVGPIDCTQELDLAGG